MARGLVLNIQRYCLHDGPGIRTTVFLKGCPLECWWCHNPESQAVGAEVSVAWSRCLRCGQCQQACPQQAAGPESAAAEPCQRCGACVEACPTGARQLLGRWMHVEELLDELLKDRVFFDESGGGITLSGGEPLMQAEFAAELLRACRRADLHTALDTCGFAPRNVVLEVAALADVLLYDVKLLDDALHRRHTGSSNAAILQNLIALGPIHDNIWIRVPVIPGVNDTAEQLSAIARFVTSLRGVRQVNLLPYHALGTHKAAPGGAQGRPADNTVLSEQQLQAAAETFRAAGVTTRIGG